MLLSALGLPIPPISLIAISSALSQKAPQPIEKIRSPDTPSWQPGDLWAKERRGRGGEVGERKNETGVPPDPLKKEHPVRQPRSPMSYRDA
jgi:hypothetical protein